MNSQQFFTSNSWWGKVIGAFLGYLIAGPSGAFFGILIGNLFDRGFASYYSRPHWSYHAEKRKAVQKKFFAATFSVMGHIAKAGGRVSEQHILMAKTLMEELGLSRTLRAEAQDYFNQGKSKHFNLQQVILELQKAAYGNQELLKLFIDMQYRVAKIEGLSIKKQKIINNILQMLGFAPLHEQHRFYEDFATFYSYQQKNQQSSHQNYHHQSFHHSLDHAYGILGVSSTSSKQEVKRAYQRLISRNHPDKLIAKGLPEEMIKIANEKTQKIRKAYEEICAGKGW